MSSMGDRVKEFMGKGVSEKMSSVHLALYSFGYSLAQIGSLLETIGKSDRHINFLFPHIDLFFHLVSSETH